MMTGADVELQALGWFVPTELIPYGNCRHRIRHYRQMKEEDIVNSV
jgi:hypothetical protein